MTIVFITGLSGVGKSSALGEMKWRGYKTVDLDYGYVVYNKGERLFDEFKVMQLLQSHQDDHLILAGTESNQGNFYPYFDQVILLTTKVDTMIERVQSRTTNPYGKNEIEQAEIITSVEHILPLLRKRATRIIDTTHLSISEVCDQIENIL